MRVSTPRSPRRCPLSDLLSWEEYLTLWLSDADIEFLDNTRGLRPFRGIGSQNANMARAICDKLLNALVDSYNRRAEGAP